MILSEILVAALLVGAGSHSTAASELPSEIVELSVCDLVHRPLAFENKHVRVRGTVRVGLESVVLTDDACSLPGEPRADVWLDFPDQNEIFKYYRGWSTERFARAVKSGELQGDGPPVRWQTSTSLVPLEPKDQALLSGALGRSQGRGVRVIITGRFDYAGGGLLIKS